MSSGSIPLEILSVMKSVTSWLDNTSQIPSQASRMKSQSGSMIWWRMSGRQVTICSLWVSFSFILKTKSPRALDKAKLPLTLLNSTNPPAASILSLSFSSCNSQY